MSGGGNAPVINAESPSDRLTVDLRHRRLTGYPVTNAELEMLASGGESVNAGFFGTCIGAAVSFGTTVLTTQLSDRLFAVYVALTVVSCAGTVLFGIRMTSDRRRAAKLLKDIRENPSRLRAG